VYALQDALSRDRGCTRNPPTGRKVVSGPRRPPESAAADSHDNFGGDRRSVVSSRPELMSEFESPAQTPGTPPDADVTGRAFRRLCEVVAKLRSPEGCPWDRQQTLETIKPHTLEETYELLEAIDSGDDEAIVEELGDVLLQVVLDA